jgi:hypothetical protein
MEDYLKQILNYRQPNLFKVKDDSNSLVNGINIK